MKYLIFFIVFVVVYSLVRFVILGDEFQTQSIIEVLLSGIITLVVLAVIEKVRK